MKSKSIRFWSWVYRKTGFVHPMFERIENEFIMNNLNKFFLEYAKMKKKPYDFQAHVSIAIGMNQVTELKLYRTFRTPIRYKIKKLLERLKKSTNYQTLKEFFNGKERIVETSKKSSKRGKGRPRKRSSV